MTRTSSTMLPLGTPLPIFELSLVKDIQLRGDFAQVGLQTLSSSMLKAKPIFLMIICAHCPFVKHLEEEISKLEKDYSEKIQIIAVCSNSLITHPQDAPENLAIQAKKNGWGFPYLLDTDQTLAKSLKAACTPDFFVFSPSSTKQQLLRYRGQLDGSRPENGVAVNGEDMRLALDLVLQNKSIDFDQKPSIGCNIKWHPGKEPSWFG